MIDEDKQWMIERLDFIFKNKSMIQPKIDRYEDIYGKRYPTHDENGKKVDGKLNHCSIEELGSFLRDLLTGKQKPYGDGHIGKVIEYWKSHIDPYTLVGELFIPNLTNNQEEYNIGILRSMLCFAKGYIPPLDRSKIPEGHCRNTGLPTHFMHKGGKQIKGRKKADCCPCPACVKLRWQRTEDRRLTDERRKNEKKFKKKKDPMRYK